MDIADSETLKALGLKPLQIQGTTPAYDPSVTTDDPVVRATRFCGRTFQRLRSGEIPPPINYREEEYPAPEIVFTYSIGDGEWVIYSPYKESLSLGMLSESDLDAVNETVRAFNTSHREHLNTCRP